ncbi:MAG: hypothetical protein QXJ97_12370 [Desulfurococcaceae archaeon]
MSEHIPTFKEVLKEALKTRHVSPGVITEFDEVFTTLTMFIKKWWIKNISQEDLQLLNELIRLIKRYGHPNYVTMNVDKFLKSSKYKDNDEIMVRARVDLLIEAGILSIAEKSGLKYWYFYNEELNPLEYEKLYRTRDDTLLTLIHSIGLKEFIDRFGFNPLHDNRRAWYLTAFRYRDIDFYLSCDVRYNKKSVWFETTVPSTNVYINGEAGIESVDDVDKICDHIEKVRTYALERMEMIRSWLKTYINGSEPEFSGSVYVSNFDIDEIKIKFNASKRLDTTSELVIKGEYHQFGERDLSRSIKVELSHRIYFPPLCIAVEYLGMTGRQEYKDLDFDVYSGDGYVSLINDRFYIIDEVKELPDISKDLELVLNAKEILKNTIIEKLREKPLYNRIDENLPYKDIPRVIGNFYKFFGWNENQNVTEVALKIWIFGALLGYLGKSAVSIPLSILFLEKGEKYYNLVAKKLEAMSAYYIASLFRRGRLKILDDGIYLDGKKLEGKLMKLPQTRGVLELIYIVEQESEQEETESRNINQKKISQLF